MKKVGRVVVVLILLSSCFTGLISIIPLTKGDYTPHAPIHIDGNDDFGAQAAEEGWPGNGTDGNPYIIEGYEINASNDDGIEIKSTSSYFIIRDTLIRDGDQRYDGITLYNVTNGIITNCVFEKNRVGISLNYLESIKIDNCSFNSNNGNGINIFFSIGINMKDNTMINDGISIYGSQPEYWGKQDIDISNTVNGKPIYYWENLIGGSIPSGAGQVILVNCSNVLIENQEIIYNGYGILLAFSSNNTIKNNNVSSNQGGICLINSSGNEIINNSLISNRWYGIQLSNSNENSVTGNKISNGWYGIFLSCSMENIFTNNIMTNDSIFLYGYAIEHFNSQIIQTSNTVNRKPLYYLSNQIGGTVASDAGQLILVNCTNMIIENLEITNITAGIDLVYSSNITVTNNKIHSNKDNGIHLYYSDGNKLINNNVTGNTQGIAISYSNRNNITNNNASNNQDGIKTYSSEANIITHNYVFENINGIHLSDSISNNVTSNQVLMNKLAGIRLGSSSQNNISNNYAVYNFKGIFLQQSDQNYIFGNNVSSLGKRCGIEVENSHNNTIINNIANNNLNGIYLYRSNKTQIVKNTALNNFKGIYVDWSNGNNITQNDASSNDRDGICLRGSNYSTIMENIVSNNNESGISISYSTRDYITNNIISENRLGLDFDTLNESNVKNNDISNNQRGICFLFSDRNHIIGNNISNNLNGIFFSGESFNNIFHHNNIVDNTQQISQSDVTNVWDDGNGEGNYWSDYHGYDENGDGVGDTDLPHQGVDHFPLTNKKRTTPQVPWQIFMINILIFLIILIWILLKLKRKPTGSFEKIEDKEIVHLEDNPNENTSLKK